MNYYNEHDPKAAAWLRELIREGHIPPGVVDERDIQQLTEDDLASFTQIHLFAGIGGWPYALRLAGWPDDREVWSGSCPCQPWSDANVWEGGGKGHQDDRHLWPDMFRLVRKRRPPIIFGEQVKGAIAKGWLDGVFGDMEGEGYACGSAILPAYAVEAEHQRDRIFWVADAGGAGWEGHQPLERIPVSAAAALAVDGYPLAGARRALAGDYGDLLPCDGVSVVLERSALKGYGNAIVPPLAQAFITAYLEARQERVA